MKHPISISCIRQEVLDRINRILQDFLTAESTKNTKETEEFLATDCTDNTDAGRGVLDRTYRINGIF